MLQESREFKDLHAAALKAGYTHKESPANKTSSKGPAFHNYEHPSGYGMSVSVNRGGNTGPHGAKKKGQVNQFYHASDRNDDASVKGGTTVADFNRLHAAAGKLKTENIQMSKKSTLLEDIRNQNAVGATDAITKSLKDKTFAAIAEARKQVAVDIFGDEDAIVEAVREPKKNTGMHDKIKSHGFDYTGTNGGFRQYKNADGHILKHKFPTTNGNHSFTHLKPSTMRPGFTGGKVWNSPNTGDTEIAQHLEKHFPKKMSEAERLKPTVPDSARPSTAAYNKMDKKDKWNAPMPWPKGGDRESHRASAISDFGDKKRAAKTVAPVED